MPIFYDYIIIGGGASGLLLADALGKDLAFANRKILVLESASKTKNDRTWCFWEEGQGQFEELLDKSWSSVHFGGKNLDIKTSIAPYSYKMLRAQKFYSYFHKRLQNYPNVEYVQEEVQSISIENDKALVQTAQNTYLATSAFNSIFDYATIRNQTKYPVLQQHFLGWFVETDRSVFSSETPTFMDFSIPQQGNTRFMYVLPLSDTKALLEYTLFSKNRLQKEVYEQAIKSYLKDKLDCTNYTITETEQGSIPMTCYPFKKHNSEQIYHIGISGGWAKPSTGFTFYRTSKKVSALVAHLKKGKTLVSFEKRNRFWFYDLLLLDILDRTNHLGGSIFESLFKKRKAALILKFLGEETTLWEELKIVMAPKAGLFIKALYLRLFK